MDYPTSPVQINEQTEARVNRRNDLPGRKLMVEIRQRRVNGISKLSICPKQLKKLKNFVECGEMRARANAVFGQRLIEPAFRLGIHLHRHLYIKVTTNNNILMIEQVGYKDDDVSPSYRFIKMSGEEFEYFMEITDIFCAISPELKDDEECVNCHRSEFIIIFIDTPDKCCPHVCTGVPTAHNRPQVSLSLNDIF